MASTHYMQGSTSTMKAATKSIWRPLKVSNSKKSISFSSIKCQSKVQSEGENSIGKNIVSVTTAAALAAVVSLGVVSDAKADILGLTPCSESTAYEAKRKKELSNLERRMKKYEEGSAPALALKATMDQTNQRFDFYASHNVLCGNDGLPHLISDPGFAFRYNHVGEIFIPTLLFIYIAGYIGYAGRSYIIRTRDESKPIEKEIFIDVPLALKCSLESAAWPLLAFQELRAGTLTEKEENITVSPR